MGGQLPRWHTDIATPHRCSAVRLLIPNASEAPISLLHPRSPRIVCIYPNTWLFAGDTDLPLKLKGTITTSNTHCPGKLPLRPKASGPYLLTCIPGTTGAGLMPCSLTTAAGEVLSLLSHAIPMPSQLTHRPNLSRGPGSQSLTSVWCRTTRCMTPRGAVHPTPKLCMATALHGQGADAPVGPLHAPGFVPTHLHPDCEGSYHFSPK